MENETFSLYAKTPSEITALLDLDKQFQGRQVYQWMVKGAVSFDDMTNLPKALRHIPCSPQARS